MLEDRIADVQNSCSRTRSAVFVSAIVSAIVFIAVWNTYFTWSRHWLGLPETPVSVGNQRNQTAEELRRIGIEQQVKLFMENKDINIGLFGIRVSSDDVPLLGSLALCIVVLWQVLTCRRANRDVASLLIEARNSTAPEMRAVYFGIRSELIFGAMSAREKPISSLEYKFRPTDADQRKLAISTQLLLYLPTIAICIAIASDLYYAAVFSGDYDLNFAVPVWGALPLSLKLELLVSDAFAGIIGFFAWRYNRVSVAHIKGIVVLMARFAEEYSKKHGCSIFDPLTADNTAAFPSESSRAASD